MCHGRFGVRLVGAQTFQDDGIGAFTVELDLSVRASNDGRHAFSRGIEFTDVENLEFEGFTLDLHKD